MADKDYAPLSTACVRALNDRFGLFFFGNLEEEDDDVNKHAEDESVDIIVYLKYVA